mmetsp:Transcript_22217/g.24755  ORF Transcript_22217/g.24755 Transcript_22217/m.24755 type:complete len:276 (-) Transcript_22217:103-930(-)
MTIALITGGAGTIGIAIAKALLDNNISVFLVGRRLWKLEEAQRQLLSEGLEHNTFVRVIPCDISNEESVVNLFHTIDQMNEYGSISNSGGANSSGGCCVDILVNNAGINAKANSIEELSASDMKDVLGVNVLGAFLCAREAIKRMKFRKDVNTNADNNGRGGHGGRIINVGSISSMSPRPNSIAYTTSKFALQGLTKSLSLDCRGHGIAVGIIHPGNVISELLSPEDVEVRGRTEGFISPEDVAKCVVTMASLPYTCNILELTVMPTNQPFIGRG